MTIARDLSKILDANGDLNIDANTLFVDSSTNSVGIGTSSPSSVLHIKNTTPKVIIEDGNNSTGGASYTPYIEFNALGDNVGSVGFSTNGNYFDIKAENYNSAPIRLFTGGSERMRIDSSGNVLVGKTSPNSTVAGTELYNSGIAIHTVNGNRPLLLNRLTSDGDIIEFRKDGTTVGSIASNNGSIELDSQGSSLKFSHLGTNLAYLISSNFAANADNTMDLGWSGSRFKDLYLGGSVYLGGTGSANALDDYEEGTWTATFTGSTKTTTGRYTKVGNKVFVSVYSGGINVTSSVNAVIGGLPFSPNGNFSVGAITHNTYATNAENGYIDNNNTNVTIVQNNNTNPAGTIVGNPKYIMMAGFYETNA